MFEAKTREYFQGVCDHFLVPDTGIPGYWIWYSFFYGMDLLTVYSLPEAGSEHKVCFGSSLKLTKSFGHCKNHLRKCDNHPPPPNPTY